MGRKILMLLSGIFFSKRGEGEYFLTSCVNNFSGKWGRGWDGVNVGRQFSASFRKYFGMNRIFSVALVYCDKLSTIASLGAIEKIKNILDCGGFFKQNNKR